MRNLNRVVWMKGMYLAPQHLQQTDRCSDAMLAFWMRASPLPPWGFVANSIDQEALANGLFSISAAQGIFPDGTIFSSPDSDPLPASVAIAKWLTPVQDHIEVQIALAQNLAGPFHTAGEFTRLFARPVGRYVHTEAVLHDELAGADERVVVLAQRNIRLIRVGEAAESDVTLGCARVFRDLNGVFRLDPGFAPPCLQIGASFALMQLLRSIVEMLTATRAALLRKQLPAPGAESLRRDVLLRDLNVAIASLMQVFRGGLEHPQAVFSMLLDAAGALSLGSPIFEPTTVPEYDHSGPADGFHAIAEMIRQLAAAITD